MQRFVEKYKVRDSGCWEWTACKNRKGYGQFRFKGRLYIAHRFSYELTGRKIEAGAHILHKCDNPSCVNPEHLVQGTNQENVDDKMRKRRHKVFRTTHCKKGHEYTEQNIRIRKDNSRACRICDRQSCNDYYMLRGGKEKRHQRYADGRR